MAAERRGLTMVDKAKKSDVRPGAFVLLTCMLGCASAAPPPKAPAPDPSFPFLNDPRPLRFHSARFELTVPLPDGHAWKIDDHRNPMLIATHAATGATLTLGVSLEQELMNRQKCEALARERGLVHDADYQTVADEVIVGPGPFDSHVVVDAVPGPVAHRALGGHVFLWGGYMKKCLFAHYETVERSTEDEAALSARLAVARIQIVGAIHIESFDQPDLTHPR
jgi:hypothetical protein